MDMNFEIKPNVTETEYIEMIRLKTAVLISASLSIGGIMGGTSAENIKLLYDIGTSIGLAFQIQDDYLDAFGDSKKFGKSIGGDILSNKKTYLLINALNSENKTIVKELNKWISKKEFDPDEKINSVKEIYKQAEVETKTEILINNYFSSGLQKLEGIKIANERKDILKDIVIKMKKREK
jgi:geranylgeranyl diphosphate synthase, type II